MDKRKVQIMVQDGFDDYPFEDLKKGDKFRMFEMTGAPVIWIGHGFVWECAANAYKNPINGVWTVSIEDVHPNRRAIIESVSMKSQQAKESLPSVPVTSPFGPPLTDMSELETELINELMSFGGDSDEFWAVLDGVSEDYGRLPFSARNMILIATVFHRRLERAIG